MTTTIRTTALALLPALALIGIPSTASHAAESKALLIAPGHDHYLPKFGFSSFNIQGYGERVTHVHWGGLAAQMGLEPGDTILSMNGYRLNYHGSWNHALQRAMARSGWVRLRIRDVRTGFVVSRQMHVGGGIGPITPKVGPVVSHLHHPGFEGPIGPVTPKSHIGPRRDRDVSRTIYEIAKLFDD